jgi:hypothetical protein
MKKPYTAHEILSFLMVFLDEGSTQVSFFALMDDDETTLGTAIKEYFNLNGPVPKKSRPLFILSQSGLVIELHDRASGRNLAEYHACTHGGWAKYVGGSQIESFHAENKSQVIIDANKIAKFYNASMEIQV